MSAPPLPPVGPDHGADLAGSAAERLGESLRSQETADELTGGVTAEDYCGHGGGAWVELADGQVYEITVRRVR